MYVLTSTANYVNRPDLLLINDILNLISIVVSIIYFNIVAKMMYEQYTIIDEANTSEDDYALFVEDIPVFNFQFDNFANKYTLDYQT